MNKTNSWRSLAMGLLSSVAVLAWGQSSGEKAETSWWQEAYSAFLASPASYKVLMAAFIVLSWSLGWLVLKSLLPKQSPTSAGRFGCFWGVVVFLVLNVLFAVFAMNIIFPLWFLLSILLVLIVILIILVLKKR